MPNLGLETSSMSNSWSTSVTRRSWSANWGSEMPESVSTRKWRRKLSSCSEEKVESWVVPLVTWPPVEVMSSKASKSSVTRAFLIKCSVARYLDRHLEAIRLVEASRLILNAELWVRRCWSRPLQTSTKYRRLPGRIRRSRWVRQQMLFLRIKEAPSLPMTTRQWQVEACWKLSIWSIGRTSNQQSIASPVM